MGSSISQEHIITDQQFITETQDIKFGFISVYKNKVFPYNYFMLYDQRVHKSEANKFMLMLRWLSDKKFPNVAVIRYFDVQQSFLNYCKADECTTIQVCQDYYTYTLADFIRNARRTNKMIDERQIWYAAVALIQTHMEKRIDLNITVDEIYISMQGHLITYPNFQPLNQLQGEKRLTNNHFGFKSQLLRILTRMMLLNSRQESVLDQIDAYSDAALQSFKRVIYNTQYSQPLKKFIEYLASQFIVNWKKALTNYVYDSQKDIANNIVVSADQQEWEMLESHLSNNATNIKNGFSLKNQVNLKGLHQKPSRKRSVNFTENNSVSSDKPISAQSIQSDKVAVLSTMEGGKISLSRHQLKY